MYPDFVFDVLQRNCVLNFEERSKILFWMIQTFLFMDNGCLLLDKRCLPISTYSYS